MLLATPKGVGRPKLGARVDRTSTPTVASLLSTKVDVRLYGKYMDHLCDRGAGRPSRLQGEERTRAATEYKRVRQAMQGKTINSIVAHRLRDAVQKHLSGIKNARSILQSLQDEEYNQTVAKCTFVHDPLFIPVKPRVIE